MRPSESAAETSSLAWNPRVTNAGAGLKTLPEKEKWNRAFETYLRELDAKKPVITFPSPAES
jgi:hypothetical protein